MQRVDIYSLYLFPVSRLVISVRHTHSSSEKTNKYPLDQIQSLQLVDCRMPHADPREEFKTKYLQFEI